MQRVDMRHNAIEAIFDVANEILGSIKAKEVSVDGVERQIGAVEFEREEGLSEVRKGKESGGLGAAG